MNIAKKVIEIQEKLKKPYGYHMYFHTVKVSFTIPGPKKIKNRQKGIDINASLTYNTQCYGP